MRCSKCNSKYEKCLECGEIISEYELAEDWCWKYTSEGYFCSDSCKEKRGLNE